MNHDPSLERAPEPASDDSYLLLAIELAAGMSYHPAIVSVIVANLLALWLGVARPSALSAGTFSACVCREWLCCWSERTGRDSRYALCARPSRRRCSDAGAGCVSGTGSDKTRRIVLTLAGLLAGLILWGLRVVSHPYRCLASSAARCRDLAARKEPTARGR